MVTRSVLRGSLKEGPQLLYNRGVWPRPSEMRRRVAAICCGA
jgi:hypothetical protein